MRPSNIRPFYSKWSVTSADCRSLSANARLLLILIIVTPLLISGCATTEKPFDYPALTKSFALPPKDDGGFSNIIQAMQSKYEPDQSGFLLIDSNEEALKWRLALADRAKHSLDLQYYLWYADEGARLFTKRIIDAANRGVKVRIIVDDLLMIDRDLGIAAMDRHPNIDVRLFNPWAERDNLVGRGVEGLERLEKLNFRMHNKLMVADNQAVIVGGRNIGNHYFGLSSEYNFHDLDVLGIGPIAAQTSEIFDHFWNSQWVHAPHLEEQQPSQQVSEELIREVVKELNKAKVLKRFKIKPRQWRMRFAMLLNQLSPGTAEVIFDQVNSADEVTQLMTSPLSDLLKSAKKEIMIVNAYFIPTKIDWDDGLKALTDRGVKISFLTNSLASNDVAAVNSHYKAARKPLIEAGVELFEIRSDGAIQSEVVDTAPTVAEFMGLHSKAIVVDRRRLFIGSMNLDPRSVNINTEMGIVIDSPQLGEALAQLVERDITAENSWRVLLDEDGDLYWQSSKGREDSQPARNFNQRVQDLIFMIFPKELY